MMMRRAVPVLLGLTITAAIFLVPVAYKIRSDVRYRNFRVVEPGVLYRSGQMTPEGFSRMVRENGIRTVITLRDTEKTDGVYDDQSEVDYCRANGLKHYRLPPFGWSAPDGSVPSEKTVTEFLRIMNDPATPKPVLIHCFAGIHRTGAQCAIFRMEYQGWSPADAIDEMWGMGTPRTTFDDDLLRYLEAYRPRHRAPVGQSAPDR
jgi:protein tyrosine/serine phosphatase